MLGAAISSVIPMLRAATQNNPATGQPLCSIANACVGDTLKAAKNGFFGGALKTADGSLKMSGDAADTTILKGIGTARKSVGKFFGSIPRMRNTSVDKLFRESGDGFADKAAVIEENAVRRFAELGNPCTSHIADFMQNMTAIFNHADRICFDRDTIYLVRD